MNFNGIGHKISNYSFAIIVFVIAAIVFTLYSKYDHKIIEFLETSFQLDLSIISLEISISSTIKIFIMALISVMTVVSLIDMRNGLRHAKKCKNDIKKILDQLPTAQSVSISQNNAYFTNSFQILDKLKGIKKENIELIRKVLRSTTDTKSIVIAKSSAEFYYAKFEAEVREKFTKAKMAQASLPLLGFAGTILGIMIAMYGLSKDMEPGNINAIKDVISKLSVAFDTTLIAVICAIIIRNKERKQINKLDEVLIEKETLIEKSIFEKLTP